MDSNTATSFQTVPEFYAGRSVLLTGATGFLGKVILEKLISGCPDIGNVYCIARTKKELPAQQRLAEVVQQDLFDTVRKAQPEFHKKVVAVGGDISLENFGMNEEDTKQVLENVSVIIHCAATVNFNEVLDLSLQLNVVSVINMLAIARKMKNLVSVVHVSTAYSQCDKSHIDEKFYEPTSDPQALVKLIKSVSKETCQSITKSLVGKRPNTYTFTKSLAEDIIRTEASDLPVAIFRPSIIGCTDKGPISGWSDNLNGLGGFYLTVSLGLTRVMPGDGSANGDIVPVDYCANMCVAIGWRTAVNQQMQKECKIYNCITGATNPVNWKEHNDYVVSVIRRHRTNRNPFQYPTFLFIEPKWYPYYSIFLHYVPAHFFDTIRFLTGKKPFMVRAQKKISRSIAGYAPFTSSNWTWSIDNVEDLRSEMSEDDRKVFYFDFREMDQKSYFEKFFVGTKKFLKEREEKKKRSLAERNQQAFMVAASVLLICLFVSLMLELFSTNGSIFSSIVDSSMSSINQTKPALVY